MKNNKFLRIAFALLYSFFAVSVSAQTAGGGGGSSAAPSGCTIDGCAQNVLNVSTGWNHGTNSLDPIGAQDANWILVSVPGNSGITLPSPTWIINPHPAWSNFGGARWVSPYMNYTRGTNNPDVPFVFRNCFCVCQTSQVTLNLQLMADDMADLYLDGTLLSTGVLYQFQWAKRSIVNTTVTLAPGQHCLEVRLKNTQGVAMGFALQGTVTGANLLSSRCCKPTSRICGTKFHDVDCDGVWDANEPTLAGWQIELRDAANNVIATATTDAWGNYCFTNLNAGTYSVNEVAQTGWTQTYPAAPGTYTFNVAPNSGYMAIFGNCATPPHTCDFDLDFQYQVNHCWVQFTSAITNVPSGYQVVATQWTFGDGTSSSDLNPTHFYTAAGWYNVCLTVTIFNGQECCTKRYCQEIWADACNGDCNIDADLVYAYNPTTCHFYFGAVLNNTNVPITNVFWDFGDGTTGTGWNPEHHFPGNGTYTVCVTLFGTLGDDQQCCFRTICYDIVVDCMCDPEDGTADDDATAPNGKSSSQGTNKAQKPSDLQVAKVYPNPNDGSFNFTINLAQASPVKVSIIDLKGSKVYEKDLGKVTPGEQSFAIDARLTAGQYICEITTNDGISRTKLVVLK